jgi:hypothetical protein
MLMRLLLTSGCVALLLAAVSAAEPKKYGEGVSVQAVTPIAAVIQKPADFAGKTIRVEGTVTSVCEHEGCWMALKPEGGPDSPTLLIKVDDGVIVFPVTTRGKKAAAQGVVEKAGENWRIKATGALVY